MTADAILRQLLEAARRRRRGHVLLHALPWVCVLIALAWRFDWKAWSLLLLALAVIASAWLTWHVAKSIDARWLARRLDARRADMDDSAALLFANAGSGNVLQRLQRARLQDRLETGAPPDLREPWPIRTLMLSSFIALAVVAGIVLWPSQHTSLNDGIATTSPSGTGKTTSPRLVEQRLDIRPPAYTDLPARRQSTLDAKLPEGTTLQWTLRFAPMPASAELVFHDGQRLPLQRHGDDWTATRRIDKSALYRVALATPLPVSQAVLHRIDAIVDTPPVLRALQPDRNLSIRGNGQRAWTLVFAADDDHGLAATARLQLIQTQGGGENITTVQRTLAVTGRGDARHKRYVHTLDLGSLGLVAGDDLIVQLDVADNRSPQSQHTRSPSFILRWPPEQDTESTGMDGLVKQTLPAYLRSQRQIILDAEALLKQKRTFDAARFAKRSDDLGVDQRMLRMRYGQFLGEESESAPPLPTNDADDSGHDANSAAPPAAQAEAHAGHDEQTPAPGAPPAKFGDAGDVVAEYGHVHDLPEAATLLDPKTKELLRAALDQMWQSEQLLRQGSPDAALPFAYKALGFIKQVQQADRIYLARTGSELPPIDESRRLGGDRTGLGDRGDMLVEATPVDPVPAAAWRALQDMPKADRVAPDYDALARWARANSTHASDPLALFAAIDAARRDPSCNACRERLREALWPMLPRPPASVGQRERAGQGGQAYLDTLGREGAR